MTTSPVLAFLCRVFLRLTGWTVSGTSPVFKKYVVVAAPHTSNWDGVILLVAACTLRLKVSFFGKDTLFFGPLGWLLRFAGGIPLDRSRHQGLVAQAAGWFRESDEFAMGLAPEGTRKLSAGWKTGFYHIANQAGVPIVLGYIDYAKKEVGIFPEALNPTGDIDGDFEILRRNYGPLTARHPESKAPIVPRA
ncbi:MAG: lysophospholipid acyltransferase family protein [Deltaproteobacteria bacterium]|nr:lysophospholipid acyltransferase family protein [Deltaproteobacteria bacterium]